MSKFDLSDLESTDCKTVILASSDMQGRLFGRRIPVGRFLANPLRRINISTCALGWDFSQSDQLKVDYTGYHTGWHDLQLVPDIESIYFLPWLTNSAIVFCDISDVNSDEKLDISPRTILRKEVDRIINHGFHIKTATELEFYLYKNDYDSARLMNYKNLTPSVVNRSQDLINRETNSVEPFLSELGLTLSQAGLSVAFSEAEWGKGQWEINLNHDEPIKTADSHLVLKLAIRDLAFKHGYSVTFMAKPTIEDVGSSSHINYSLWDKKGQNVFFCDKQPPHCSKLLRWSIGGILQHVPDLMMWFAPTINSYRRTNSSQFAGCGRTWGLDNRTTTCRVSGRTSDDLRIEFRLPGADMNPYLGLAAILASTSQGINDKIDPGEPIVGNAYENAEIARVFPSSLHQAAKEFDSSLFTRKFFGQKVVRHYSNLALFEASQFAQTVTDWERERYFEGA